MVGTYETLREAWDVVKGSIDDCDLAVYPDIDIYGNTVYKVGTWQEYDEAVNAAVALLIEPGNSAYTGEDVDDLVSTYNFTLGFAVDVCGKIEMMLEEIR